MQRRDFVKISSLSTAGLLTVGLAKANFYIGKKPEVIILGAGFAGLSAALHFHQRGIPFTVLKARNRIGERVFSFEADPK